MAERKVRVPRSVVNTGAIVGLSVGLLGVGGGILSHSYRPFGTNPNTGYESLDNLVDAARMDRDISSLDLYNAILLEVKKRKYDSNVRLSHFASRYKFLGSLRGPHIQMASLEDMRPLDLEDYYSVNFSREDDGDIRVPDEVREFFRRELGLNFGKNIKYDLEEGIYGSVGDQGKYAYTFLLLSLSRKNEAGTDLAKFVQLEDIDFETGEVKKTWGVFASNMKLVAIYKESPPKELTKLIEICYNK